jgi:hypothetical protein
MHALHERDPYEVPSPASFSSNQRVLVLQAFSAETEARKGVERCCNGPRLQSIWRGGCPPVMME